MMLKKMVEEYETIKGNMILARKQFGNHQPLVNEYRNQLDDLYTRYFGESKSDNRLKKDI